MMQTVFPQKYEVLPSKMREAVLKRDKYTCQKCLKKSIGRKLQVHHKIAMRMGGQHLMDNLMTLCRKCHKILEPAKSRKYAYKVNGDKSTVQVYKSTVKLLRSFGKPNDTYDSIINRFLNTAEQQKEAAIK